MFRPSGGMALYTLNSGDPLREGREGKGERRCLRGEIVKYTRTGEGEREEREEKRRE